MGESETQDSNGLYDLSLIAHINNIQTTNICRKTKYAKIIDAYIRMKHIHRELCIQKKSEKFRNLRDHQPSASKIEATKLFRYNKNISRTMFREPWTRIHMGSPVSFYIIASHVDNDDMYIRCSVGIRQDTLPQHHTYAQGKICKLNHTIY